MAVASAALLSPAPLFSLLLLVAFLCFSMKGTITPAVGALLPLEDDGGASVERVVLNGTDWEIIPSPDLQNKFFNLSSIRRRRLGEFHICALCTCCGGFRRLCLPTGCCYSITCGSPNRPFGLCSFTPIACNCFDCHLNG